MAVGVLVHASDGLVKNRMSEKKPGLGGTMDGISCDSDDETARCSHCHTFSLNVHNLLALQKHFVDRVCPVD